LKHDRLALIVRKIRDHALMQAPRFWWQPGRGLLLSPLAALYGAVAALRLRRSGRRAGVPVICLGNLTVGGAGKTPAALAVGRLLLASGERPFFLSRGYGGRLAGPVLVSRSVHRAADVGDEPLLLAQLAPTIVARNRLAGAQMARREGAGVVVMDDGFQNPTLHKDLAIVVIDGRRGIGNGRVLPAGPLRAPLQSQMARAHALIVVGAAAESAAAAAALGRNRGLPVFHARLEPDPQTVAALAGRRILAFAGIADPDKFFATLADAGLNVVERQSFADHHRYTAAEAQRLLARAQSQNLVLLTTEKDQARLAGDPQVGELAARANALPARLVIDEADAFRDMVLNVVKRR
jgi:tetraacyldisaccharide 4'-kinase